MKFTFSLLFLSLAVFQSTGPAIALSDTQKEQAAKLSPGTYWWNADHWVAMEQLSFAGAGMKHAAKMFVPGLTPQIVYTFRGAAAPVQVGTDPVFCTKLYAAPAATPYSPTFRDITIARFDEKKDHRELQITSGGNFITFKSGVSKERLTEIDLTQVDDVTAIFSPRVRLKDGEYIISATTIGLSGYDFGHHSRGPQN